MDILAQAITYILGTPTGIIVLILGAGGVSVLTQVSKRLLKLEKDNEKLIMFIFMLISFSASGLEYLLSAHNLPPTILGVNMGLIMGVATPLYIYAVKPLTLLINDAKIYRSSIAAKVSDIEQVSAAQVAAVAPATPVVPVVDTPAAAEVVANLEQNTNNTAPVASF